MENFLKTQLMQKDYDVLLSALDQTSIISMTDALGNIIYVNQNFLKISKYSLEELLGQNHRILKSGHQPEEMFVELWKTISSGKVWRGEVKNRAKDGSYYWGNVHIAPIMGLDGKPERYISLRIDTTEKKKLEELRQEQILELEQTKNAMLNVVEDLDNEHRKLLEAKAKDDAILASIGEGLAIADQTGKLVYLNKNAEDILGVRTINIPPDAWQKEYGIFDPVTLKLLPTDEMPLLLAVNGKEVAKRELIIRNTSVPNGKFISVTAEPIMLDGESIGGVATFHDTTKEKEIDKAKSEFASIASHQLRTPLTAIRLFTEMLLDDKSEKISQQQKEYLMNIHNATKEMVVLVRNLLSVARIETGKLTIEPEPLHMEKLCEEIIKEVMPLANEKGCTIILEKSTLPISLVPLDRNLFHQVVHNFLTNAIRYTPKEKGKIVVKVKEEPDTYILSVADNGIGIVEGIKSKIFEKFFRADNAKSVAPDGTGLGLYIAKTVFESAGGKIWFESEGEGKGSTFFISLPKEGMSPRAGEWNIIPGST